ncbi:MAG: Crp/Fnr family transcriptional regulator [Bacteroidota bacterium]
MQPENLIEVLSKHPFIGGLDSKYLELLVGCATNMQFKEGDMLFHEGEFASKFYLIRRGRVALEIHAGQRGSMRIQTVESGGVLGWSFLISPFRWHFDAVAVEDVRAFALDGKCLRMKCETDHDFGYEMLKRLAEVLETRLQSTRLQLIDFYSSPQGDEA